MLNNQVNLDSNLEEIKWRGRQIKLNNRRRQIFTKLLNEKAINKFIRASRAQTNMDEILYKPTLYRGDTTSVMDQLLMNYQNNKGSNNKDEHFRKLMMTRRILNNSNESMLSVQKIKDSPVIEIRANTNNAFLSQLMVNTYYDFLLDKYHTDKLVSLNAELGQLTYTIDSLETLRDQGNEKIIKFLNQRTALTSERDKYLNYSGSDERAIRRIRERLRALKSDYEIKSQFLNQRSRSGSGFTLLYNSFEAHCTQESRFKPSLICFTFVGIMLIVLFLIRGMVLRVLASDSYKI